MRRDLADLLAERPDLPPERLELARQRQQALGGTLDTALLELGLIREEEAAELLALASDLPFATPDVWAAAGPELAPVLPQDLAEKHGLAPLRIERRQLTLVVQSPVDLRVLDEIGFLLSRSLRPLVATELRVRLLQQTVYGKPLDERLERLLAGKPIPGPGTELRKRTKTQPQWTVAEPPVPLPAPEEGGGPPKPAPPRLRDGAPERTSAEPAERPDPAAAIERLRGARTRDQVVAEAIRFARGAFAFVAVYARRRQRLWVFERSGPGAEQVDAKAASLSLAEPSVLGTVVETRAPYVGPVPAGDPLERSLGELGRRRLRAVLLYPVVIRDRTVLVLYGDGAGEALAPRQISDVAWTLSQVGPALERLLTETKQRERELASSGPTRAPAAPSSAAAPGDAERRAAPPAIQLRRRPATLRWGLAADGGESSADAAAVAPTSLGAPPPKPDASVASQVVPALPPLEAEPGGKGVEPLSGPLPPAPAAVLVEVAPAPAPAPIAEAIPPPGTEFELDVDWEEAPAPPDVSPAELVRIFLAGSAQARAEAEAKLSRGGVVAAEALCNRFPGPLFVFRTTYDELPGPDKLGPVLGLLARMGPEVVPPLSAVADGAGEEKRFWSTVLLAKMGLPSCLSPLARRVFDPAPDVAQAARRGLWHLRSAPEFPRVLESIALDLASPDPARAAQAARALGSLHSAEAVPRLIERLSSRQGEIVEASVHGLREITRQDFGTSERRWSAWWSEASQKPRLAWLVDALEHRDPDIRLAALGELAAATGRDFGYKSDLSPSERAQAVSRWRAWWESEGRYQRLSV